MVILAGIIKVFREMRSGAYDDQQLEEQLNRRGLMNRFMGCWPAGSIPLEDVPVGLLFGLGLDTATEVALLVLARHCRSGAVRTILAPGAWTGSRTECPRFGNACQRHGFL